MIKENVDSVCFCAKITEIRPIEGADNIELVVLDHYQAISSKGVNQVGDLVVLCCTDAVIPEEISNKLGISSYLRKGTRVKTIKLKGVYSECLIIKPSQVFIFSEGLDPSYISEGEDFQKLLNIYKYEEPEKVVQGIGGQKVKYKDNPEFRVYTKFPNIKNYEVFRDEDEIIIQEKIHGTNFRCGIVPKLRFTLWERVKKFFGYSVETHEILVGTHRVNLSYKSKYTGFYEENVYQKMFDKYNLKDVLITLKKIRKCNSIELYGEIYGPGIQKHYDYNLKEVSLVIFDIQVDGKYEDYKSLHNFGEVTYIPVSKSSIPIKYIDFKNSLHEFGFIKGTKVPKEGVVLKHCTQGQENLIACKMVNPDYAVFSAKNEGSDFH